MKHYKREIMRVMDEAVANGEAPCASIAFYRHGEEKLRYVCGMADIEAAKPLREDSLFRLYSLTKPVTAVTAMALVERGQLDLLAPVKEFLPGFAQQTVAVGDQLVPAKRDVTVRDLFSMTSGLTYPGEGNRAEQSMAKLFDLWMERRAAGDVMDTQTLCNEIGKQPLAFQPGEGWNYGTSADVLGTVLEVASGQKLDALMNEVVFSPLSMRDTAFFVPLDKQERFTTLYARREGKLHPFLDLNLCVGDYITPPRFLSGGAGLVSTLDDMLRFARMLLGRGALDGERIISERSVAYISQNHLNEQQLRFANWDSLLGYGYGGLMRVLMNPAMSFSLGEVGEYGWDGWTGPYMTVCPAQDMTIVMMQQRTDCGITELTRKVRNILYAHLDMED